MVLLLGYQPGAITQDGTDKLVDILRSQTPTRKYYMNFSPKKTDEDSTSMKIPPDIEKSMWKKVELVLSNWTTFEQNRGCVFVDHSAMSMDDENMYYFHPLKNREVMRVTIPTNGDNAPKKVEIGTY